MGSAERHGENYASAAGSGCWGAGIIGVMWGGTKWRDIQFPAHKIDAFDLIEGQKIDELRVGSFDHLVHNTNSDIGVLRRWPNDSLGVERV